MLLEQARLRDERRRMVEDLVASERRFRAVFTDSPVGLVVLDSDKRVLSSNPAFCSMLGVEEAEVVGLPLADLMLAPDRGAPQDGPPNADTGLPERARFEARMQASGGSTVWTHVTVSPLKNREDGDHHQLAIIEDVTERVRSEEAERGRDAILRAVGRGAEMFLGGEDWDAAADGFLGLLGESADLRDVAVIRGCAAGEARVLHRCLSQREAAGTSQREAAATRCASQRRDSGDGQGHPREAGEVIQAVVALGERLMAGLTVTGAFASAPGESAAGAVAVPIFVRQACWGCMVIEASAASREWHQVELDALRTAADLFGDAVQDRDAAQELRTGEERTRLIVDTALDAVISVAGDGTISGWNAQARDTFGWEAQEAAGKDVVNFVAPPSARAEWTAQGVGATWSWDQPPRSRFETVAVRKDGSIFPAEVAASGTRLNDAVMMGVFVRDLTTQKAAQAELEEARRQDESVAARIQRAMLVGDPPIETPRLGIASETRPGQVIAGDFVANLRHDENTIDVVVGDVMGKGSNAALLGAITKGHIYQATRHLALRLLEFGRLPEPHEVVAAVHEQITRDLAELESFVTLLYARLDLRAMRCTLVDCGHTRTVHYSRRTGECTFIKGDNLPLGVADREFFTPIRTPFEPGDVFFFYSDGVIEAESPSEELFGEERVIEVIKAGHRLPPMELIGRVRDAVLEFCGDKPPGDDITCLAVSVGEAPPERFRFQRAFEISGTLDGLEPVRAFVRDFCASMPGPRLATDDVEALMLAAHEATCNVITHAHQGRPDIPVQILAEAYDDRVELRLFDIGVGFALGGVTPPSEDGTQPSGYGLFLIQQLVDEVTYERDELGRNYLSLRKRRGVHAPSLDAIGPVGATGSL